jgi:hypothetical protein
MECTIKDFFHFVMTNANMVLRLNITIFNDKLNLKKLKYFCIMKFLLISPFFHSS